MGSYAFVALPRVAFAVVRDPDDEDRRLLLHVKNNIALEPPGLAFRIEQRHAGFIDGDPSKPLCASCVEWEHEHVSVDVDYAIAQRETKLRGDETGPQTVRQREAESFLQAFLASESKPAEVVRRAAEDAGISYKILRGARQRICETSRVVDETGKIKQHLWCLKETKNGSTV